MYLEYVLLDHFRCTPSELDEEDENRLLDFLFVRNIVNGIKQENVERQARVTQSHR